MNFTHYYHSYKMTVTGTLLQSSERWYFFQKLVV